MLPHFAGGSEMIEGRVVRSLTEEGISAVMVNMGHQQDGPVGHLWLQQELDKDDLTNIY